MTLAPIAFFTFVAILTGLRLGQINLGTSTLWRLAIPSWRFYEEVGEVVELSYRTKGESTPFGPWEPVLKTSPRGLFLNSEENLLLACKGLVGQMVCEIADNPDPEKYPVAESVAYKLVTELTRHRAEARSGYFQFKVSCVSPRLKAQDYLVSGVHSA